MARLRIAHSEMRERILGIVPPAVNFRVKRQSARWRHWRTRGGSTTEDVLRERWLLLGPWLTVDKGDLPRWLWVLSYKTTGG